MEGLLSFLENFFGQDGKRRFSVKVVITYTWLTITVLFMVMNFLLRIPIPDGLLGFFRVMGYIIIGSYFAESGVKEFIGKHMSNGNG